MGESGFDENDNIEYDILLKVKNGKYFMQVKELNILTSGDNLREAYEALMIKKKKDW